VKDGPLRRRWALIASPQFLLAVLAGLQVSFVCSGTNEMGEKLVGSHLYPVHLHHRFESNNYDRSYQPRIYI
jgi:hypothetical protein